MPRPRPGLTPQVEAMLAAQAAEAAADDAVEAAALEA